MPDAGDEKVWWPTVVGRNGPRQARRAHGEGELERAVGMHQTQDMIRKERLDGKGAEDAWGPGGSSGVNVVFADVCRC